ncbi:MAG: sigma-70 family RNA polymerase sigma factor [Candidatus Margulisbacteria bacterium]|jgi:RNA polymerase sigma factor for flagellar operon FliA|nr:sigma-70 family RNA polymerase sigma factor [Candidatus Margulisiibacteriota bacterium]
MSKPSVAKQKKSSGPARVLIQGSVEAYMPLVHSIASMVSGKGLPPNIEYDDLVSDGTVGLMKAWENFDPKRGVKFETYASYRIRGEMLDGLKNYSPVPYRVQVMVRDLAKKGVKSVISKKEAAEEELLEKRELSEDEFKQALKRIKKIVSASALMYLLSIQGMSEAGVEPQVSNEGTPDSEADFAELKERIRGAVYDLPQQQRQIIELFFHKGINQKTIAEKLRLSRPKVCRVISKAIEALKKKVK